MKRATYHGLAAIMEPWLAASTPRLHWPAMPPRRSVAVYVGLVDGGPVAYVGSVCRRGDPDALAARLREHRALERWNWIVVFPLKDETPGAVVLDFEGIAGRLLMPTENRRLPKTWLPSAPRRWAPVVARGRR
jgi:hypothetical protein